LEDHLEEKKKYIGESKTLLILDDEPDILMMLQGFFEEKGYRVFTASSGKKALEMFSDAPQMIDLAIVDIIMPEMGGVEVLEEMIKIKPESKVVFISGYHEEERERLLIERGAVGFVKKPFSPLKLLQVVEDALREKNKRRSHH